MQLVISGESSQHKDYIGFKIDPQQKIMFLIYQETETGNEDQVFVKISSLDKEDVLLDCEITDSQMKGIFES